MTHSHIPVRHLLKQLEGHRAPNRPARDVRPPWLVELIEQAARLFDPHEDVARAGYDCRLTEDGWEVDLFLGSVEHVGGPVDGSRSPAGFQFDLRPLAGLFTRLASLSWHSPHTPHTPAPDRDAREDARPLMQSPMRAVVRAEGWIAETPVRLSIHSTPPETAGPGLRKFPDGRIGLA